MNNECEGCSKLVSICSEYIKDPQIVINDPLFCNDKEISNKEEIEEIVSMMNDIYTAFTLEMDMLMGSLEGKLKD